MKRIESWRKTNAENQFASWTPLVVVVYIDAAGAATVSIVVNSE